MTTSIDRRSLLAIAACAALADLAVAQALARQVPFIVPQPAGNPTDGLARKLQPLLQKELAATVVVENVPGAGGSLGVGKLLAAPADTQSLLIASQHETILAPTVTAAVRYKADDLRPVALLTRAAYVLVGRPDLPATTLAEVTALARRSAEKPMSYGAGSVGSMLHLMAEVWRRKAGLQLTSVPYRGTPAIVQDLMGSQIDLAFLPMGGTTASLVESGRVRAFGTTTGKPIARLPDLRPLTEQDKSLGDFLFETWGMVLVSRAQPEASVIRLHQALARAVKDDEFQKFIISTGTELVQPMSLEELDAFYRSETLAYQRLARDSGIVAQ